MVKKNIEKLHTFVIPAYGESPYLEDCIRSLIEQRLSSGILMVTSTPNQYISCLSQKYQIPLCINHGEAGISGDWNFGISQVHTPLFTIAHQDDVYLPEYSSRILEKYRQVKKPIIFFTDYWELRNDEVVKTIIPKYSKDKIEVTLGEDVKYYTDNIDKSLLKIEYDGTDKVDSKTEVGSKLGTIHVKYNNENLLDYDVILDKKITFSLSKYLLSHIVVIITLLIAVIFVIFIIKRKA